MSLGPLKCVVLLLAAGVCSAFAQLHFHGPTCEGGKGGEGSSIAALGEGRIATMITKPAVVSRTSWGCPDGQGSGWTPQYTTVSHLIVHHSATANTSSDWAETVRSIWNFHTNDRGWGDVGYNYLIDPNGVIYEGRAGGDNVIGAHFSCQNRVHDDVVSGRQSLRSVAGDPHRRCESHQHRWRRADCCDATGEFDHVEFRAHLGPGRC